MLTSDYVDRSSQTEAFIEITMILKNVNITYDVDSELEDYNGKRFAIIIWIDGLQFKISLLRNHATGILDPSISFYNYNSKRFQIINFPSNPYSQLIAKEVRRSLKP